MIPLPRPSLPFDACPWCGSTEHKPTDCDHAPQSSLLLEMANALERLPSIKDGGFYADGGNPLIRPLAQRLGARLGDCVYVPFDPSKEARIVSTGLAEQP